MTTYFLYDNLGNQIGTLKNPISLCRDDEINGAHTLTVQTKQTLQKRQYILFYDRLGVPREYIVSELDETDEAGTAPTTAICEDSLTETTGDYIEDKRPEGGAAYCLGVALEGTRWEVGIVDVPGSYFLSFYQISVREAINKIVNTFGGELSATIEVIGSKVVSRKVNIRARVGGDNGKRFTYSKDLVSITRHVEVDDVCTAMYGYGKGLEKYDEDGEATGGYERKLKFGEINGGKDYVENLDALKIWGRPDDKGQLHHVFGSVVYPDCEDMAELKQLTEQDLERRSVPQVTYEAKVIDFRAAGYDTEGVDVGDGVDIIDLAFPVPLRLKGRVLAMHEDYLAPENNTITLGNVRSLTDSLMGFDKQLESLNKHSATWDAAGDVSSNYINEVMRRNNQMFEAAGTYKYESYELGTLYTNVPLDDNFKPTKRPAWAMQLSSAGFRIANTVKPNGDWDWRTFGTGEGFTADVLNVGTIRGGSNYWNLETGDLLFKAGSIQDSKSNYWNMTNGTLNFQSGTINASMLTAGIIKDQAGTSSWNLATGELSMTKGRISDSRGNYWDMSSGTLNFEFGKINADTITAGSITVRNQSGQTILKADIDGHTAEVGGFDAESEQLTGTALRVNLNRLEVISTFDTATLGWVGASWISGNEGHAYRFVALNSSSAAYCAGTALSCNDTAFLICARIDIPYSSSVLTGNQIHVMRDLNFHQYSAINFKAQGGVSGTFANPKSITVSGGIVTAVS